VIETEEKKDNKSNKKKRRPWRIILLLIVLAAGVLIAPYVYDAVRNDPNIVLKRISAELTEDKTVNVLYRYNSGKPRILGKNRLRLYSFTPAESGEYTFDISNIVSEKDVFLSLQVTDSHFNNYLSTDNMEERSSSFSDTVFLNEGSICYVITEAISEDDRNAFSGSFSLTVSKAQEGVRPKEITEDEPATIKLREDSQTSVLFVPAESGYFRFASRVISRDRSASSSISSVRTTDNKEIKRSGGICRLEGGKEYYVWVSAQDMSRSAVKARVSCSRMEPITTDQPGEYVITGGTVIEYKARATQNIAVYSVSDGDVRCSVYDSMGFPLNSDNDTGGELSGNEKDFALVIRAQKRSEYLIYANGKFNNCRIVIAEYTGDGTTIGKDDIIMPENNAQAEKENAAPGAEEDATGVENNATGAGDEAAGAENNTTEAGNEAAGAENNTTGNDAAETNGIVRNN